MCEGRALNGPMGGNNDFKEFIPEVFLQPDMGTSLPHDDPAIPLQRTDNPFAGQAGHFAHKASSKTSEPDKGKMSSSTGSR